MAFKLSRFNHVGGKNDERYTHLNFDMHKLSLTSDGQRNFGVSAISAPISPNRSVNIDDSSLNNLYMPLIKISKLSKHLFRLLPKYYAKWKLYYGILWCVVMENLSGCVNPTSLQIFDKIFQNPTSSSVIYDIQAKLRGQYVNDMIRVLDFFLLICNTSIIQIVPSSNNIYTYKYSIKEIPQFASKSIYAIKLQVCLEESMVYVSFSRSQKENSGLSYICGFNFFHFTEHLNNGMDANSQEELSALIKFPVKYQCKNFILACQGYSSDMTKNYHTVPGFQHSVKMMHIDISQGLVYFIAQWQNYSVLRDGSVSIKNETAHSNECCSIEKLFITQKDLVPNSYGIEWYLMCLKLSNDNAPGSECPRIMWLQNLSTENILNGDPNDFTIKFIQNNDGTGDVIVFTRLCITCFKVALKGQVDSQIIRKIGNFPTPFAIGLLDADSYWSNIINFLGVKVLVTVHQHFCHNVYMTVLVYDAGANQLFFNSTNIEDQRKRFFPIFNRKLDVSITETIMTAQINRNSIIFVLESGSVILYNLNLSFLHTALNHVLPLANEENVTSSFDGENELKLADRKMFYELVLTALHYNSDSSPSPSLEMGSLKSQSSSAGKDIFTPWSTHISSSTNQLDVTPTNPLKDENNNPVLQTNYQKINGCLSDAPINKWLGQNKDFSTYNDKMSPMCVKNAWGGSESGFGTNLAIDCGFTSDFGGPHSAFNCSERSDYMGKSFHSLPRSTSFCPTVGARSAFTNKYTNNTPKLQETPISRIKTVHSGMFGTFGHGKQELREPNGLVLLPNGTIIISDGNAQCIKFFSSSGQFLTSWGVFTIRETRAFPNCISLYLPNNVPYEQLLLNLNLPENKGDPGWGIVVVLRRPTPAVQLYTINGEQIREFATHLNAPKAVTVDQQGTIIVVESHIMRVSMFSWKGVELNSFTAKHLAFPISVCVDSTNQIYITDNLKHYVLVYNYDGQVIRTIGSQGVTNFPFGAAILPIRRNNDCIEEFVVVVDNHNNLNITIFRKTGEIVHALQSVPKHAQVYAATVDTNTMIECSQTGSTLFSTRRQNENTMESFTRYSLIFSSKDAHVYRYALPPNL